MRVVLGKVALRRGFSQSTVHIDTRLVVRDKGNSFGSGDILRIPFKLGRVSESTARKRSIPDWES